MHVVAIQGQVKWEWYQDPSSRRWIAVCRPLKLVLEADTHTELLESIADSMRLLMRSVYEDGEFAQFLNEQGWQASNIPQNVSVKNLRFDVPMEIVRQQAADGSARQSH